MKTIENGDVKLDNRTDYDIIEQHHVEIAKHGGIELREAQKLVLMLMFRTSTVLTFMQLSTAFGKSTLLQIYADSLVQLNPK